MSMPHNTRTWSRPVSERSSRGVSLLVVMLVGSVMVLAAVSLSTVAKRVLQSSESYQESLQSVAGAEDVFACVEWWINKDVDNFNTGKQIECFGEGYHFLPIGGNKKTGLYEFDSGFSTSTFTVEKNVSGGAIEVEVVRDHGYPSVFMGKVILHAYNIGESTPRNAERLRVYNIRQSPYDGADIVFLMDRSGSIGGTRAGTGSTGDWGSLLRAVGLAVHLVADDMLSPQVSYVTFGTESYTTGEPAGPGECAIPSCVGLRKPDVSLTPVDPATVVGTLIEMVGLDFIANNVKEDESETNLSLGLAIAGSELMGLLYPSKDSLTLAGEFERLVANWGTVANVENSASLPFNATTLPTQSSPQDRDDAKYPDYIVLITDGQPNGIVRHLGPSTVPSLPVTCAHNVFPPVGIIDKGPGDSIFFAAGGTDTGDGCLVSFIDSSVTTSYEFCNDAELVRPNEFSPLFTTNAGLNPSKCNAYITAEALKRHGITIIVVGVGSFDPEAEEFMKAIASEDYDGNERYFPVVNYTELEDLFSEFTTLIIPSVLR